MNPPDKFTEMELPLGVIYESRKDIGKSIRAMKHNAWGLSLIKLAGTNRFVIYEIDERGIPDYTCTVFASHIFRDFYIGNNHHERYVTD